MNISRDSYKNNYLKNIILRLDFNGVLDAEMEKVIAEAKQYLKTKDFNKYDEKINNEVDLDFGNAFDKSVVKDVRKFTIYTFRNEQKGYELDMSKNVVCLKINTLKYIPFEEYEEIFLAIVNIYNDVIDFFTPKRLGLRKINFCFMDDIEKLNDYFCENYFENSTVLEESENVNIEKRKSIILKDKNAMMNIITAIQKGIVQDKELSKIILDLDVYSDDQQSICDKIFNNKSIATLNEAIFGVYKNAMTDKFHQYLMKEEFNESVIRGIEKNE